MKIKGVLAIIFCLISVANTNAARSDEIPLSQCWPCEKCYDAETCNRCEQYYVDNQEGLELDPDNCYEHCYAHQKIRIYNTECPFKARCKHFCKVVQEHRAADKNVSDKQACDDFLNKKPGIFHARLAKIIQHPWSAIWALYSALKVQRESPQLFPTNHANCNPCWNGPCDAYRHCYWSCSLSKRVGEKRAERITEAHEYSSRNPCEEMLSDLKNNQTGFILSSEKNCSEACLKADLDVLLAAGECQ